MGAVRAGAKRAAAKTSAMAMPNKMVKRGLFKRDMFDLLVVWGGLVGVKNLAVPISGAATRSAR